jgi:hypothetical protein
MKRPTDRQLDYINRLITGHERKGSLAKIIAELHPDLQAGEDFRAWAVRQDRVRVSDLITHLEARLGKMKILSPEAATEGLAGALSGLVSSYKRKGGRGYYRR